MKGFLPNPFAGGSRRTIAPGGRGSELLRTFDRTLVRCALIVIGAVRRRRTPPVHPRRIGIMKSTGIGDMILATAIASDVRRAHPDAEVILFAGSDNADIARLVPGVRTVQLTTARPWSVIPLIRSEQLDAFIDLGQWTRLEALYAVLSGAWCAGFDTEGHHRAYAFDATVPHRSDVPEMDNYRSLAETLGVQSTSDPRFDPAEAAGDPPVDGPFVVFHPWPGGYRSELREWPAERWRDLATVLTASGHSIVITGAPADAERSEALVRLCGDLPRPVRSIAGDYRLHELVDVVGASSCVVSVNTGLMHLAAAAGAPTVALNGPTSSRRWGPIGPRVRCVDSDLPGCGFLNLGFEYDGRRTDCMSGISVERVATAVEELIDD